MYTEVGRQTRRGARHGHLLKINPGYKITLAELLHELLNICEINQRFIYKAASIR